MTEPEGGYRGASVRLATVTAVIVLAHAIDAHWRPVGARVAVAGVVFLAFAFDRELLRRRWVWGVLTAALASLLFWIPYRLANHHYLLIYVALAFAIANGRDDRRMVEDVRFTLRWMLVAVMAIAVVQRLLSPEFMDGSYLAYLAARGGLFGFVRFFSESAHELVIENEAKVRELAGLDPNRGARTRLTPPFEGFADAARGFAVFILVIETWIAAAFAFFRRPWIRHTALLPFVAVLGFTRSEFVFAAILALIGLGTCELEERRMRGVYTLLAVILTACVFLFPVETGG